MFDLMTAEISPLQELSNDTLFVKNDQVPRDIVSDQNLCGSLVCHCENEANEAENYNIKATLACALISSHCSHESDPSLFSK